MKISKSLLLLAYFTISTISVVAQDQIGQDIDGIMTGESLGNNVSMSADGTIVAVAANGEFWPYSSFARVFEYKEPDNLWVQKGQDIEDLRILNYLGGNPLTLSVDGKSLAIVAKNDIYGHHLRVFHFATNLSSWVEKGQEVFGNFYSGHPINSVSITDDGNTIAASLIGSGLGMSIVKVFEYQMNNSIWVQKGEDINSQPNESTSLNVSMSYDGKTIAIGAPENSTVELGSGQVRVFDFNSTSSSWEQKGQDLNGLAFGGLFGHAVSMSASGNILAVGETQTYGFINQTGFVKIYTYNNATEKWEQMGLDILGESEKDLFGHSISLSSNGKIIAIGTPYNESKGVLTGHARVYEYYDDISTWLQVGEDIDGEASEDQSGNSVSLSADGTKVAIGAPYNDGSGENSGHVRVFDLSTLVNVDKEYVPKNYQELKFYPNPAEDVIHMADVKSQGTIKIYDQTGKLVLSQELINSNSVDVQRLLPSTYIIAYTNGHQKMFSTLVKK